MEKKKEKEFLLGSLVGTETKSFFGCDCWCKEPDPYHFRRNLLVNGRAMNNFTV